MAAPISSNIISATFLMEISSTHSTASAALEALDSVLSIITSLGTKGESENIQFRETLLSYKVITLEDQRIGKKKFWRIIA